MKYDYIIQEKGSLTYNTVYLKKIKYHSHNL